MASLFLRTLIIYIMLIAVLRFMGKRQIGQMQLSELITALLLSELASQPLTDADIPIIYAVIPILLLVSVEVIMSYLSTKSNIMKKILDSNPSIIIKKGQIDQREMLRMRMSMEELMGELRLKGISAINEVDYAILEQNGQISVLTNDKNSPLKQKDMNIKGDGNGIEHMLIVDGHLSDHEMQVTGKNKEWIFGEMKKRRINDIKDIFLMTVDDRENTVIIRKEAGK
ncbi:MAG: DUF421 domain-containing protein [Eubacteriales bacterium]